MIVDSSALVAVALEEPGFELLVAKLGGSTRLGIGAPTAVELAVVLTRRAGADRRPTTDQLLSTFGIAVIPFGEEHWRSAKDAFARFGTGRHPAALNFGDCLTYAVAKLAGQPLLFVGEDFNHTDLQVA